MSGAAPSEHGTVPVYSYTLDDAHFRQLFDRSRARKGLFRWRAGVPIVLMLVAWVVLLCACISNMHLLGASFRDAFVYVMPLGACLLAFAIYRARSAQSALRQFRKSIGFGTRVETRLTPQGILSITSTSETTWYWATVDAAVAYPDGLLIVMRKEGLLWLADSTLVVGSREVADRVLQGALSSPALMALPGKGQ